MEHYVKNKKMVVWKMLLFKNVLKVSVKYHCSWVKRLYDHSFHEWKIIPLRLIKNVFANSFSFHSNLKFKRHHVKSFTHCYRDILVNRKGCLLENQRYHLTSFLKIYDIINIFELIRDLSMWSNFLIKS